MTAWFEAQDTGLDDWTLWTQHRLARFPFARFDALIRKFPEGYKAPSFREVLRFASTSPHGPLFLCSLFSGGRLLVADPVDDETSYLAAPPDPKGHCCVFRFNPRTSCLAPPGWPSLGEWLSALEAGTRGTLLDAELLSRSRRTTWLTMALLGIGYGDPAEDAAGAAPMTAFPATPQDRGEMLYWLWHHAIAGNRGALTTLLAQAAGSSDPWVVESAEWIQLHGEHWDDRFGCLDFAAVKKLRQHLAAECFEGERQALVPLSSPPAAYPSAPDEELAEFERWLRDDSFSQRDRLQLLLTERRPQLQTLFRRAPEQIRRILYSRLNSKRLKPELDALVATLAAAHA